MPPDVVVCGYVEAAGLVAAGAAAADIRAVLDIAGQREHTIDTQGIPHALRLHMDDVVSPDLENPVLAALARRQLRHLSEMGLTPVPPSREDAAAIVSFADSVYAASSSS